MDLFDDTQLLFAQLAAVPDAQAVRSVIENHDAWQQNELIVAELDATVRIRVTSLSRNALRDVCVQNQRRRLRPLVTKPPLRRALPAA